MYIFDISLFLLSLSVYIYIYIYIHTNYLPVNAIVRLYHPWSEDSQYQETFLAHLTDSQIRNSFSECSNYHPSLSTLRSKGLSRSRIYIYMYIYSGFYPSTILQPVNRCKKSILNWALKLNFFKSLQAFFCMFV